MNKPNGRMSLFPMEDLLTGGDQGHQGTGDILDPFPNQNPTTQPGSALDSMLADPDDDDLFSPPAPQAQQSLPDQPVSALVAWQREKDGELQAKDAADAAKADEIKAQARASADTFFKTLEDSQQKRALHNKELDEQKLADLASQTGTQWEKVVKLIDFNRSDLHERDVAKFKSLLLQLKH
jgi:hypothetical protein